MKRNLLIVLVLLSLKSISQVSYLTDPYANRRSNYNVFIFKEKERESYIPPVNLELMSRVLTQKENEHRRRINELQSRIDIISELIYDIPVKKLIPSKLTEHFSKALEDLNNSNISDINVYNHYLNYFNYLIKFAKGLATSR